MKSSKDGDEGDSRLVIDWKYEWKRAIVVGLYTVLLILTIGFLGGGCG